MKIASIVRKSLRLEPSYPLIEKNIGEKNSFTGKEDDGINVFVEENIVFYEEFLKKTYQHCSYSA